MKKISITVSMLFLSICGFSAEYHITKLTNLGKDTTSFTKETVIGDLVYTLTCGMDEDNYTELQKSKLAVFVSETGQNFTMVDWITKFVHTMRDTKAETWNKAGSQNNDFIYILNKSEGKYTIDIYTGADALKNNHLIQK